MRRSIVEWLIVRIANRSLCGLVVVLLGIATVGGCSSDQNQVIKADEANKEAEAEYMRDYAEEQQEGY